MILSSIKSKLILVMLSITLFVIIVISFTVINIQRIAAHEQANQSLRVLSDVIAENSEVAVLFDDKMAAEQTLEALSAIPDIIYAKLFDEEGKLFASYHSNVTDNADSTESLAKPLLKGRIKEISFDGALHSSTPLFSDGEFIGVLLITDNMAAMTRSLSQFYRLVAVTAMVTFLVTIAISLLMLSIFTVPLTKLLKVIAQITSNRDYSQRVNIHSNDEFSVLALNFNNMIDEIEKRGAELESINSALELRVADRTEDLQQALKLSNEANRAKTEFLAVMSHEIRTPLNGIIGFSELLSLKQLDKDGTRMVGLLNESAQSLLRLLNEMLDFSKLDANKVELDLAEFDLEKLLNSAIEGQRAIAETKNIEICMNMTNNITWHYIGDAIRIRQIINNLINNAIKFTDQGKITIDVSFKPVASDSMVTIRITDTGIGIETSALDSIFSPFTQADNSVTRKHGGTGLGLAICEHLITLMNGQYGVESTLGKGSSFWFSIPLQPSLVAGYTKKPMELLKMSTSPHPGHILVAEDNSVNQLVVEGLLASLGHTVELVENGLEALNRARTKPFDLVLMDYHMPEMDGIIATQKIRELGPHSVNFNTPIIALTADIQPQVRKLFHHAGANDILLKPLTQIDLETCLTSWLHKTISESENITTAIVDDYGPILVNAPLAELCQLSTDSGESIVKKIVDMYMQSTPELIKKILQAIIDSDSESLFRSAHSLKSSSGSLGAERMQNTAKLLEQFGRDQRLGEAKELTAELNIIFESTKLALEEKMVEFQ